MFFYKKPSANLKNMRVTKMRKIPLKSVTSGIYIKTQIFLG